MIIDVGNVWSIDSLNLLQMPLSNPAKSFGFEKVALKGFFPHLFNTPDHYTYIRSIPYEFYFHTELISSSTRSKFDPWYHIYITNWWSFVLGRSDPLGEN